jgi:AcrR family transcriptional regulator
MDELAATAQVSRATLYRIFPGKSALFRELIATYSLWESIARVLEECLQLPDTSHRRVLTRPLAALVGLHDSREAVVDQVVDFWLRAMAPT